MGCSGGEGAVTGVKGGRSQRGPGPAVRKERVKAKPGRMWVLKAEKGKQ